MIMIMVSDAFELYVWMLWNAKTLYILSWKFSSVNAYVYTSEVIRLTSVPDPERLQ